MEQRIHDKHFMPSPGANQPKHGYSTLADSGSSFNLSKPKVRTHTCDCIEQLFVLMSSPCDIAAAIAELHRAAHTRQEARSSADRQSAKTRQIRAFDQQEDVCVPSSTRRAHEQSKIKELHRATYP